ncbi:MAG TPA: SUMF1/EgtB/PvdO family nonheme iron enzyme, partial [Thermotogota bacterium]|nr:SUMF1/EgtB/PvdO family nonheme iron enzyme [Thermotogota bacterium]
MFVTEITITGEEDRTTVSVGGTLQMILHVQPENATSKAVTWTVENASSIVSRKNMGAISQVGALTGLASGTVVVKAISQDGSGVVGEKVITIVEEETAYLLKAEYIDSETGGEIQLENGIRLQISPNSIRNDTSVVLGAAENIGTYPQIIIDFKEETELLGEITLHIPLPEANNNMQFYLMYYDETGTPQSILCEHTFLEVSDRPVFTTVIAVVLVAALVKIVGEAAVLVIEDAVHQWNSLIGVMKIPPERLLPGDILIYANDGVGHAALFKGGEKEDNWIIESNKYGEYIGGSKLSDLGIYEGVRNYNYCDSTWNLGARRIPDTTDKQREKIIAYADGKVKDKAYWSLGGASILWTNAKDGYAKHTDGKEVFSCIGLVDRAYREAGICARPWYDQMILYPSEYFNQTIPIDSVTMKPGETLDFQVYSMNVTKNSVNNYSEEESPTVEILQGVGSLSLSGDHRKKKYTFSPPNPGVYEVTFRFTSKADSSKYEDQTLKIIVQQSEEPFEPGMVLVEGGTFQMGNTRNDGEGNSDEKPVHTVNLTYDYWIGKCEVTFSEYDSYCEALGRSKPSDDGWGRGQRPVIWINWWE